MGSDQPVYVKLKKTITGSKVPKPHEDVVKRGALKGLEYFVKKQKILTTAKKSKGFALWAEVPELDVKLSGNSARLDCKMRLNVAHLPQEVRPKARVSGGGRYQANAKRLDKEIEHFVESVTISVAEGKVLTYMKQEKDKL